MEDQKVVRSEPEWITTLLNIKHKVEEGRKLESCSKLEN